MASSSDTPKGDMGVLRLFEEGRHFTEEVLRENERLRLLATKLRSDLREMEGQFVEAGAADLPERLRKADEEMRALRAENERLRGQFASVEQENREFAERYVQVERQNSDLISMYVASYRLHSTLEYRQVLDIVKEIVINMVGAERFGIYLADAKSGRFQLICHEGLDGLEGRELSTRNRAGIAEVLRGQVWYATSPTAPDEPIALIPLRVHDKTVGVVEILNLMTQKRRFEPLDRDLFDFLAKHAATAIYSASLYTHSERKLHTLESFLDLLRATMPELPAAAG